MNEVMIHRVDRINVHIRDRQNQHGEPYQVIFIKVFSERGDMEFTLFGKNEESVTITYGEE